MPPGGPKLTDRFQGESPMDERMVGFVGGIAGGVIGVMSGLAGSYFSIKNASGPRARAFIIRAAVLFWLGSMAFLTGLFLVPRSWNLLLWVVYFPALMLFIRWVSRGLARAEGGSAG